MNLAIKPSPARTQHDRVERVEGRELIDTEGQVATPWRVVPILQTMARRQAITEDMRRAGEEFATLFRLAQLDGLRCASLMRASGAATAIVSGNERARKAVNTAIASLGGGRAPAASCVWHVLGLEWSLRRWSLEYRRGSSTNEAAGILIAALGVLAR